MKQLKEFTIPFVGLKVGQHHFDYNIDQAFFDHFEYEDFNSSNVKVDLTLVKKETLLELNFQISGTVNINCDLTNEPFDQSISNEFDLVVKFGEDYNDENIDILIIPHGEYEINVQQYIYELIVLALREKSRKQEEIKEEHIIKQLRHKLQLALQLVKLTYTIEHTGVKENFTTEVKY